MPEIEFRKKTLLYRGQYIIININRREKLLSPCRSSDIWSRMWYRGVRKL
jgi:hypothetical protein